MKAKLTFDLPDEQAEFDAAVNGTKYGMVIWELDQKLRSMEKYEDIEKVEVDKLRSLLREIIEDCGLSVGNLL